MEKLRKIRKTPKKCQKLGKPVKNPKKCTQCIVDEKALSSSNYAKC